MMEICNMNDTSTVQSVAITVAIGRDQTFIGLKSHTKTHNTGGQSRVRAMEKLNQTTRGQHHGVLKKWKTRKTPKMPT